MAKAPTKTQVLNGVAERSGLSKKEVAAVMDGLASYIGETISDGTPFTIPGLCKIVVQFKEAQPERPGTNPFTGEETIFKAKPARNVVKVRPLKGLKDMAGTPADAPAAAPAAAAEDTGGGGDDGGGDDGGGDGGGGDGGGGDGGGGGDDGGGATSSW